MTSLLLASASPARRQTLRDAGIDPHVVVSDVDEDAVLAHATATHGPLAPVDAVLLLAHAKAEAVAARVRRHGTEGGIGDDGDNTRDSTGTRQPDLPAGLPADLLVLGCDSLLDLDGEAHGKPADATEAVARWRRMRGRSGLLHTGHWLVDLRPGTPDATVGATSTTVVHFADLTDAEIEAYVATGEPLAVAGAFTVDGRGGPFVERIEGDHHGVVGVSLPVLRTLLRQLDLQISALWSPHPH